MINNIINDIEKRMKKCVDSFKTQIKKVHTGRISPGILDNITINRDNKNKNISTVPIRNLSNILTEDAHTLVINVFDTTITKKIEQAIAKSDLDLHVTSNKNIIQVRSPFLTENRRQHLIKLVHIEAEKTKISIRNIRRSLNDQIKISLKNKKISEDKERYLQNKVQECTNIWTKKINNFVKIKETELKSF